MLCSVVQQVIVSSLVLTIIVLYLLFGNWNGKRNVCFDWWNMSLDLFGHRILCSVLDHSMFLVELC